MFKEPSTYKNIPRTVEMNEKFINLAHEFVAKEMRLKKINEKNFININKNREFSRETVERDIELTDEKRGLMYMNSVNENGTMGAELMKKVSEIFEFLFYNQIKNNKWLNGGGEEFNAYLASDFDDVNNGVDVVLEKKKRIDDPLSENTIYGAAIDVTNSSSEATVERKISSIEDKIINVSSNDKKKRLPKIKYFKSELTGQVGPVDAMANMLVGASFDHVLGLFSQVFRNQINLTPNDCEIFEGDEPHPLNMMVLEQLFAEAYYLKLLSKYHGANVIEQKYTTLRRCADSQFRALLAKYKNTNELKHYFANDQSHQAIMKTIKEKLNNLFAQVKEEDWRKIFNVRSIPDINLLK